MCIVNVEKIEQSDCNMNGELEKKRLYNQMYCIWPSLDLFLTFALEGLYYRTCSENTQ